MKASLDLDVTRPEQVYRAVTPSLRDTSAVQYDVSAGDSLHISLETEGLGPLRGATNTALMLTKLAEKVVTIED